MSQEAVRDNKEWLDHYSSPISFPQAIILEGMDKEDMKEFIAYIGEKKLYLPVVDITDNLVQDTVAFIYTSNVSTLYVVDYDSIQVNRQGVLLKLLEEPPLSAWMILYGINSNPLTDTCKCRCTEYVMKRYTQEELSKFSTNKELVALCDTPGQVERAEQNSNADMKQLSDLCDKILNVFATTALPNALKVSDTSIAYENDKTKFDLNLFIKVFEKRLMKRTGKAVVPVEREVVRLKERLNDTRVNKKRLFDNFLLNIWKVLVEAAK